jgi:outer membrane biosynthesis protein TonB
MGGNNTKQAVSEWNNYRTSDQSSAIPYEAQIHTKYENNNNINELINNLHTTEKSDFNVDIFTKLLNNTSSYNTKYQNKPDTTLHASAQDTYESPFLSPAKYANLLNSETFDNAQHGGARLPNTHKTPTKAKKPKKPKKPKTPKSKPEPETESETKSETESEPEPEPEPEPETESEPEPKPEPPTSSTDSDHDNTQKSDETTDEDLNNSDEVSEGTSTSESHNKYESPSSASNSVHTSQINMLDSY